MIRICCAVLALVIIGCNKSQPMEQQVYMGRRVYIVESNVSLILPDSTLKHEKSRIWGSDCKGCGYDLFHDFYFNQDSSIRVSIRGYTNSVPSPPRQLPWRIDVNQEKRILTGHYAGSKLNSKATTTSDSVKQTVEANAHIIWRSRRFYAASMRKYGPQRVVKLDILIPDEAGIIQAAAMTRASLYIKASYLNGPAKPYPGDIDKP